MDLVEKLEKQAKVCNAVWDHRGYNFEIADLRELLEQAAKQIRSDRAWIRHLQQHSRTTNSRSF